MKQIALPQEESARKKRARSLRLKRKIANAAVLVFAIIAIACLIGVLICAVLLQTGDRTAERDFLFYLLTGIFAACAVVLAFAAFGVGVLGQHIQNAEMDYLERCCGEDCFYVGEGTVAQFGEKELFIRSESEKYKKTRIYVPYHDIVFHSVCTREKPREKGKWSVVLEIPSHYVMKRGDSPKAFVETQGKERLYNTLAARGLQLKGESPLREGEKRPDKRYKATTKLVLPDAKKRRHNLIMMGVSALMVVVGIVISVFWGDMTMPGALVSVLGIAMLARGTHGFVQAKGMLALGENGLYWKESGAAVGEKIFLKWEVIDKIKYETIADKRYLAVVCPYGTYHLPDIAGAYEWIEKIRPELTA